MNPQQPENQTPPFGPEPTPPIAPTPEAAQPITPETPSPFAAAPAPTAGDPAAPGQPAPAQPPLGGPAPQTPGYGQPQEPPKKKGGIKAAIISVVVGLVSIIAYFGVSFVVSSFVSNLESKESLISRSVDDAKSQISLPQRVDSITTLVDITAQQDAVRYHYEIKDVSKADLEEAALKDSIISGVCSDKDVKGVLDKNINLEYFYTFTDGSGTLLITIVPADCA